MFYLSNGIKSDSIFLLIYFETKLNSEQPCLLIFLIIIREPVAYLYG